MGSAPERNQIAVDPVAKARLLHRAAARESLRLPAYGSSMGWTIPMGSEVLVAAATNPRRGELWAYCDDRGGIVVHRYRRRIEAGHVLQGDTCVHADAPVNDEQLIGRVVSVLYHGRVLSVGWCNRILGAAQRVPRSMAGRTARTLRRVPFPVARADARRR